MYSTWMNIRVISGIIESWNHLFRRMTDEQRRIQSDILSYSLERFSCFSTVILNGSQEYEKEIFASLAVKSQHLADKKHYAQGSFMVLSSTYCISTRVIYSKQCLINNRVFDYLKGLLKYGHQLRPLGGAESRRRYDQRRKSNSWSTYQICDPGNIALTISSVKTSCTQLICQQIISYASLHSWASGFQGYQVSIPIC